MTAAVHTEAHGRGAADAGGGSLTAATDIESAAAGHTIESPALSGPQNPEKLLGSPPGPTPLRDDLMSPDPVESAAAVAGTSNGRDHAAFQQICAAFDDEARDVRSAAARALYDLEGDRADSFTRALRGATPERRRQIGAAIASSGLAAEAISRLAGESRERTYEAFSLLFLMAQAGEITPLVRAIEGHPSSEVRLAVVKLLALSGREEILPTFRRLKAQDALPAEVRAAVADAIDWVSSQARA